MNSKRPNYVVTTRSEGVFLMKNLSEYMFLWTIGGCIYYGFELFFRGYSHWSMFILGGLCFLFFWIQGKVIKWQDPLWLQVLRCMVFVTAMEFITGIIVNKWLRLNVWDYSRLKFQLFGQISLQFSIIFSGLSAVGILLSAYLMHWIYGEEKPHFHIL